MVFPALIGGIVVSSDFPCSVLFAVLYAALLPILIFRLADERSRSVLLITTSIFSVERIIIYSLRAAQTRSDTLRISPGLIDYLQVSFAIGFINIANDQIKFLLCLAVNTTFNYDAHGQGPPSRDASLSASDQQIIKDRDVFPGRHGDGSTGQPKYCDPDYPRRRFWFRRANEFSLFLFTVVVVLSTVANRSIAELFTNQSNPIHIFRLRYAATAVGLIFILFIAGATILAYIKLPYIRTKGVVMVFSICILMSITAIYRLSVMYNMTDSLYFVGPNSLNSARAKAYFYIFHVLPEWLASLIILCTNLRQVFGIGPFRDLKRIFR